MAGEFNYEALLKALEQLSDFERRANSRVIESGVLKGLNLEDIKRAGERLILQDGCTNFFQKIVKNEKLNADVHLLSYCWCADLIRSAFSSGMSFPRTFEYRTRSIKHIQKRGHYLCMILLECSLRRETLKMVLPFNIFT